MFPPDAPFFLEYGVYEEAKLPHKQIMILFAAQRRALRGFVL